MWKKVVFLVLLIAIALLIPFLHVHAQTDNCTGNFAGKSQDELKAIIATCSEKLNSLKEQKNTLSSQIQYMDTEIYLATLKIQDTEQKIIDTQKEIDLLTSRIGGLDNSLSYLSKLLINRVVNGYKNQSVTVFDIVLNSDNAGELINKLKYYKTIEQNNQKVLIQVQEAKLNDEQQKQLREKKKVELDDLTKSLQAQKSSLDLQKNQKQQLLTETQNDETTYQRLLAQAQAQLAGFTRFVNSQGGASLLSNQTICNDWGCYYNQRDSQWGSMAINNSEYSLASAGCLISSMSMIYTHYGHRSVNPSTIASNPLNFFSTTALLNFTVVADGVSTTRVTAAIDSELSQSPPRPVIAGISYDGGPIPDHYVVLTSGSSGNYQMNDPFTENGHDIALTSHYTVGSIVAIYKVEGF